MQHNIPIRKEHLSTAPAKLDRRLAKAYPILSFLNVLVGLPQYSGRGVEAIQSAWRVEQLPFLATLSPAAISAGRSPP